MINSVRDESKAFQSVPQNMCSEWKSNVHSFLKKEGEVNSDHERREKGGRQREGGVSTRQHHKEGGWTQRHGETAFG